MTTRTILTALVLATAAAAPCQRPAAITLKPANGSHPAEFVGIGGIRELADGRVIVLDDSQKKVFAVDFRSGKAARVSGTGEGPQEYKWPVTLFALPGDSSVIVDIQLRRWVLLAGDRPVATIPPQSPLISGGSWQSGVRGADASGRVAMFYIPHFADRDIDQGDSIYLVRMSRATGHTDTVTRLRSPFGGPPGSASKRGSAEGDFSEMAATPGSGAHRKYMMNPIISDQAIVFPDGWVAVARVAPYRIDWIDNLGKLRRGTPLPVPAAPMNDREKRAYLAWISKIDGAPPGDPSDIKEWIAAIPPFWGLTTSLFAAPDGSVLIARAPTAAQPNPSYDLVTRAGAYRGQLVLKPNTQVVGFGAHAMYLAVTDADGIEKLERHPWP